MYHQPRKSQSTRAQEYAVGESEPGPQQQSPLKVRVGFPPQTTSVLGHGGLETSVSECDSCHLVGTLRHSLDRPRWVGGP